jgi:hypothetical protein
MMVSTDLAHPRVLASVGVPSRTSTVVNGVACLGVRAGWDSFSSPSQSLFRRAFRRSAAVGTCPTAAVPHKIRWDRWDEFADLRAVSATSHWRAEHLVIRSTRVVESGQDPIS